VPLTPTVPLANHEAPRPFAAAPRLEHTVRAWHNAGHSQDAIAREFSIDRRKVKSIIDQGGGVGSGPHHGAPQGEDRSDGDVL